jgi:DNA-binding NtrC family response regulator
MKLLFMSGYPAQIATGATRAGASFLQKPLSVDALTNIVSRLLEPDKKRPGN